jgi:hypothetical protein
LFETVAGPEAQGPAGSAHTIVSCAIAIPELSAMINANATEILNRMNFSPRYFQYFTMGVGPLQSSSDAIP